MLTNVSVYSNILSHFLYSAKANKNNVIIDMMDAILYVLHYLQGIRFCHDDSILEAIDRRNVETFRKNESNFVLAYHDIYNLMLSYMIEECEHSIDVQCYIRETFDKILDLDSRIQFFNALLAVTVFYFYASLLLIRMIALTDDEELRVKMRQNLEQKLKRFKIWVKNCPDNYKNKYLLIQAEMRAYLEDSKSFAVLSLYHE